MLLLLLSLATLSNTAHAAAAPAFGFETMQDIDNGSYRNYRVTAIYRPNLAAPALANPTGLSMASLESLSSVVASLKVDLENCSVNDLQMNSVKPVISFKRQFSPEFGSDLDLGYRYFIRQKDNHPLNGIPVTLSARYKWTGALTQNLDFNHDTMFPQDPATDSMILRETHLGTGLNYALDSRWTLKASAKTGFMTDGNHRTSAGVGASYVLLNAFPRTQLNFNVDEVRFRFKTPEYWTSLRNTSVGSGIDLSTPIYGKWSLTSNVAFWKSLEPPSKQWNDNFSYGATFKYEASGRANASIAYSKSVSTWPGGEWWGQTLTAGLNYAL